MEKFSNIRDFSNIVSPFSGVENFSNVVTNPAAYPTDQAAIYRYDSTGFLQDVKNGPALTNNNGVTNPYDPVRGDVAGFNGTTQYFSGAYTGNSSGPASWSLWFNRDTTAVGVDILLGGASSNNIAWFSSTSIRVKASGVDRDFSLPSMNVEIWHNLVVVRDSADDWRVYLNGVESSTGALNTANSLTLTEIGRQPATQYWTGELDNIQYFNRALSLPEIVTMYGTDLRVAA